MPSDRPRPARAVAPGVLLTLACLAFAPVAVVVLVVATLAGAIDPRLPRRRRGPHA